MEQAEEKRAQRKIVVVFDLKDYSKHAFEYFCDSLHKSDDDTILYYCHHPVDIPADPYSAVSDRQKEKEKKYTDEEEEVKCYLNQQCHAKKASAHIKIDKGHKNVGEGICAIADGNNAGMIVMGVSDLSKFLRKMISGTSDHVMHNAHRPIFCIPKLCKVPTGARTVLVAVDSQKHSKHALEFYYNFLHKNNDNLILYFCHQPVEASNDHHKETKNKDEEKEVTRYLDGICKEKKISPQIRLDKSHKKVGEGICDCAEKSNVDLVVMGTRRLSFLRRHLTTGTSHYVMHHIKGIPLLSVPEPKED